MQKRTKKITAMKTQADVGSGESLRDQTRLRSSMDAQQRRLPCAPVRAPDFSRPKLFSTAGLCFDGTGTTSCGHSEIYIDHRARGASATAVGIRPVESYFLAPLRALPADEDARPEDSSERGELHQRVTRRVRDVEREIPIDLIVHTRPMHQEFLDRDSMFARKVTRQGRVLYEKSD